MDQKMGAREATEALTGILELSLAMAYVLRDGAQASDIGTVIELFRSNSEFKAKLQAAVAGAAAIPSEVRDLDLQETIALVAVMLGFIPRFVDAFSADRSE